jgi:hypothetical protein
VASPATAYKAQRKVAVGQQLESSTKNPTQDAGRC